MKKIKTLGDIGMLSSPLNKVEIHMMVNEVAVRASITLGTLKALETVNPNRKIDPLAELIHNMEIQVIEEYNKQLASIK